jgi:hypothetical protein
MSRRSHSGILITLLLGAACLALGSLAYSELTVIDEFRDPRIGSRASVGSRDGLPDEPTVAMPSTQQLTAIIERPIFSQTRRPAAQPVEAPKAAPPPTLDLELVGVVTWQSQRFALVRPTNGERAIRVDEGGSVSGWTIVVIEADRVLFRNGELEKEIKLKYNTHQNNG